MPASQDDQLTGWDEALENSLIFSNPFADTTELHPTNHSYFKAGLSQDFAGNASGWQPGQSYHEQGKLGVAETGFGAGKEQFGMGGWEYNANPDAFTPPDKKPSTGMYVLAERSFYDEDNKSVLGFAKAGRAAGNLEQTKNGWSTGFIMKGFVDDHPDGQFGFAVSGGAKNRFGNSNDPGMNGMETRVELTYQDKIADGVTIQPGLNFNVNPGSDPGAANGLVAGLRLHIKFK